jgi:Putative Actinobacterial Holin-X, holin superfamily III
MAAPDDIGAMPPRQERTIAGLFADLARETSRLFRQEVALAKAELVDKTRQLGGGAVEIAIGGFILYAGLLVLLEAAVFALALVLPIWAAALVVGGVAVLIGGILLLKGRADVGPRALVPDRTLRSLREDAEWAREQMR